MGYSGFNKILPKSGKELRKLKYRPAAKYSSFVKSPVRPSLILLPDTQMKEEDRSEDEKYGNDVEKLSLKLVGVVFFCAVE